MNNIKYFFQFIFIIMMFFIFKIIGFKYSSFIGGKLFQVIGPFFRSKKVIHSNMKRVFPNINPKSLKKITDSMWENYGRVFAEYMFIKDFRSDRLSNNITIEGKEILDEIREKNLKAIFVSGHFSNFELMAMQIEKSGINLAAIYRPLNNIFLNHVMEKIRRKYICRHQIKKGIPGLKKLIRLNKEGYSTALMIDQRVSQGIKVKFFNEKAFTTTIPAQLVKKFNIPIVPIFMDRSNNINFKMKVLKPLEFSNESSIEDITIKLNEILEKMILENPDYWIWSHNRWK